MKAGANDFLTSLYHRTNCFALLSERLRIMK